MATLYWGDSVSLPDGNWNHVQNWYLTLGVYCGCGSTAGTPANRIPQAGDTVVLAGGNVGELQGDITTGPTTPVNVPISWYQPSSLYYNTIKITAGTYIGSVTIGTMSPGTASAASNGGFGVSGGTFSGAVTLAYAAGVTSNNAIPSISGGTFTGTVTRLALIRSPFYSTYPKINYITGGTYSPTATCAVSGGQLVTTNLPNDPGFAAGGGTYSPTINVTGIPDILGAGLL